MKLWRDFIHDFNLIKGRLDITPAHIYLVLKLAADKDGVSRYIMTKELDIGEATARTLQNKLKELDILKPIRSGHILTNKGTKIYNYIISRIIEVGYVDLLHNTTPNNYVIAIKRFGDKPNVFEMRDEIVRNGGLIGLILYKERDKIIFPDSGDDLDKYYPEFNKLLEDEYHIENGDVIIVAGGKSYNIARLSALNTALKYI